MHTFPCYIISSKKVFAAVILSAVPVSRSNNGTADLRRFQRLQAHLADPLVAAEVAAATAGVQKPLALVFVVLVPAERYEGLKNLWISG